jgi:hypothetical protein
VAFLTERPEVALSVVAAELQRDAVVKLAVMQINCAGAHTAMPSVAYPKAALKPHAHTATDTPLLTINGFDASGIHDLKPWFQGR